MQTFLPLPDFTESAKVLDWRRLGNQRVEVKQLLNAIVYDGGWRNHPAAKMWKGHAGSLCLYGIEICTEWRRRGYRDTLLPYFTSLDLEGTDPPFWVGMDAFHAAHRSNLLRKDPVWYGKFGWTEPPDLEYVWPC